MSTETLKLETMELEEEYLQIVKWNDMGCYSMKKPLMVPSVFPVFQMDNRPAEIAVVMRGNKLKIMTVIERAKQLIKKDFIVQEKGVLYGKRKVLAALLKEVNPLKTFETEHNERVKDLYDIGVFTEQQALERLKGYMNDIEAKGFLKPSN